jgi:hypothetical protein
VKAGATPRQTSSSPPTAIRARLTGPRAPSGR